MFYKVAPCFTSLRFIADNHYTYTYLSQGLSDIRFCKQIATICYEHFDAIDKKLFGENGMGNSIVLSRITRF